MHCVVWFRFSFQPTLNRRKTTCDFAGIQVTVAAESLVKSRSLLIVRLWPTGGRASVGGCRRIQW